MTLQDWWQIGRFALDVLGALYIIGVAVAHVNEWGGAKRRDRERRERQVRRQIERERVERALQYTRVANEPNAAGIYTEAVPGD
jgi:hypothetical protein